MDVRTEFPHRIREIENTRIPLSDGTRLAARIWLPDDAETTPVPAILEYLPYRKDDENLSQDSSRHPYFAGFGYAGVRVDIRGTGDSDGIIEDEYTVQEQLDALEVIEWLAGQSWCSGAVGMVGYSWGGFNGLQVAARRPPALKAVVTMYSTDDRYSDDCHYSGGCVLGSDMLKWASSMRFYNALPPDPRFREDWREVWLDRLARTPAFIEPWLAHQTRGEYWRQGSVCVDYSAITAATLVVGGWTDAYTNAVPRLLERLNCERRGIIGPWAHVVPNMGVPRPRIGFLQECLRWFGRWLKDEDTGVERDPFLRVWLQDSLPPADHYETRPGCWIEIGSWPPSGVEPVRWALGAGGTLGPAGPSVASGGAAPVAVHTPQHVGHAAGVWCANGRRAELPIDQRADDADSVCFDSGPLPAPLDLLGFPVVRLTVASSEPQALLAVRLCEVAPDGASTLLSWGQLNLTHRDGDDEPAPLVPSQQVEVRVQLNAIGQRVSAGNRLRVALSSTHWPHAWPSPAAARLELSATPPATIELPVLRGGLCVSDPYGPAEVSASMVERVSGGRTRTREADEAAGHYRVSDVEESVSFIPGSGTTMSRRSTDELSIIDGDPLSARVATTRAGDLVREGWDVRVECEAEMTSTATEFEVTDTLRAYEDGRQVFSETRTYTFPRDNV